LFKTLILLLIDKIYCCEVSQAVPARPSGKDRLVAGKTFRSEEGSGRGSRLFGVRSRGKQLSTCTEFCVWTAALRRNFDSVGRPRFGGSFEASFGMAAPEPHSPVWMLGANSLFALGLSNNTIPSYQS
jgi:hypothetical protein